MRSVFLSLALIFLGLGGALLAEAPPEVQLIQPEDAETVVAVELETQEAEIATTPNVLDLATVHQAVLEANPTLQAAQHRMEQALERVKQARSLWFPQLQVNYSASHTNQGDEAFFGGGGFGSGGIPGSLGGVSGGLGGLFGGGSDDFIEDEYDSFSLNLRASYILFDGFNRHFTNLIAKFGREETEALRVEVERQLLNAASNAYFGIQLARENVLIAEADIAFNERLLKDAQARRRVGLGTLSDELNFEVQIRAAKARLIRAQANLENTRVMLAALMGLSEAGLPANVEIAALKPESPALHHIPILEEHMGYALNMRPDLLQRRFAVERAEATVKQERSSWYPQMNIFASYDGNRQGDSRFKSDNFSSTVGLNVTYDLFTGGRNRAQIAEKKYAQAESEHQLAELELQVASEVRQEVQNLRAALEQLDLQRETAAFVEKNRTLVEKEYQAGQGTLTRLTQAQRDLVAAQGEFALARVALRQAWHNLYTASGRPVQELATLSQAE